MPYDKLDSPKINPQSKVHPQKNYRKTKRTPRKITKTYLHNAGIYYLERFAASKNHFKVVMLRKVKRSCMVHIDQDYDECAQMVDAVADKFVELGLLNDDLYTNGMVNSLRRKGLSRNAILNKMQMKGIDRDKSLFALQKLDGIDHETEKDAEMNAALKLARKKKLGPYAIKEVDIKKALGVFARAGYSYDIAKSVLDMKEEDLEYPPLHF